MLIDWLIDRPSRELPLALYISGLISDGNVMVTLDHQDFYVKTNGYDYHERTKHNTNVIVTPNYNTIRSKSLLARAIRTGAKGIVVQHSEQMFPETFYREKFNLKDLVAYQRHVGAHIVWGKDYAKKLISNSGIPPDKIYITGNPKLELAQRIAHLELVNAKSRKPTVLFSSNFNLGDLTDKQWSKLKRLYDVSCNVPLNKIFWDVRNTAIDWMSCAAESFKDIHFIVRKHPGENERDYNRLLKYPNIEVAGDKPFVEDLKRSNIMLCYTSSSMFEAVAIGMPVYNLNLRSLPVEVRPAYYDDLQWTDRKELMLLLDKVSNNVQLTQCHGYTSILNRYMWQGGDNTILRNAIAIKDACSEIAGSNTRFKVSDKLRGLSYNVVPFMKNAIIYFGYLCNKLSSIDNIISTWANRRWQQRLTANNYYDKEIENSMKQFVYNIYSASDHQTLKKGEYSIIQGTYGKYVRLKTDKE